MIGIFGGTFDPVHFGHLRSALEVKEIFDLTEVRMIPSARPPHREPPAASAEMRLCMLKLALENHPGLICDARELDRGGCSYMVDTLRSLQQDFPERTLLLFIGCDAFHSITTWYQWQKLFTYAHLVVLTRPGFAVTELGDFLTQKRVNLRNELLQTASGKLFFQPVTPLAISSTSIREIIAQNLNPGFLLPDVVYDFIRRNRLYRQH